MKTLDLELHKIAVHACLTLCVLVGNFFVIFCCLGVFKSKAYKKNQNVEQFFFYNSFFKSLNVECI